MARVARLPGTGDQPPFDLLGFGTVETEKTQPIPIMLITITPHSQGV